MCSIKYVADALEYSALLENDFISQVPILFLSPGTAFAEKKSM